MKQGIGNILKCWELTDDTDRREGLVAYQRYHDLLRKISLHYKVGFCQTVASFVALSPNNDYIGNLRSLVSLIEGVSNGCSADQITVSTYKACKDRAYLYFTGESDFLLSTKGPKTIAFYHNIINPNCSKHVTIDGHMYGVWIGKRLRMVEVAHTKIPYSLIEQGFKQVAKKLDIIPNQLQATLWFTWKRHHKVLYNPQLNLHNQDDVWGINVRYEDIKPFVGKL